MLGGDVTRAITNLVEGITYRPKERGYLYDVW